MTTDDEQINCLKETAKIGLLILFTCLGELLGADAVEVDHVLVVLAEQRVGLPPGRAPAGRRREGVAVLADSGAHHLPFHRALGRRLAGQRRRAEPAAVVPAVVLFLLLLPPRPCGRAAALRQELPSVGDRPAVHEQLYLGAAVADGAGALFLILLCFLCFFAMPAAVRNRIVSSDSASFLLCN